MTNRLRTAMTACVLTMVCALPARAQDAPIEQLRVFIDCSYMCDMDFMRQNVNWVSYMQDRSDAHVHVLVASQSTGGGGQRYNIEFIGLREFAGSTDTLVYTTSSNDTDDIRRRGLTRTIALGLMPFVARTGVSSRLNFTLADPAANTSAAAQPTAPENDPWNFWNFRISMNGNMDGETSREAYRISSSISANRTTEDWKISLSLSGNYNEQKITFCIENCGSLELTPRDTTIRPIQRSYSASTLTVKSITPHLSLGARTTISTSTFGNTELSVNVAPAVEYSIFPYEQATTRALTVLYSAGMRRFEYRDTTIYNEIEETRPAHNLTIGYSTRRPWGSVDFSVDGTQYLHDTSKYSGSVFGGLSDIRLFKGFSLNLFGDYSLIRNQLALPRTELTPDEVLLRQREIATNYRYFVSMGISYRFGSIFNNVVNPRFGGSGSGMMIMM
jgi:hypothetical protein